MQYASAAVRLSALDAFVPTHAQIDALPDPIRRYIQELRTRHDRTGDTTELALAKNTIKGLWMYIRELEAELASARNTQSTRSHF